MSRMRPLGIPSSTSSLLFMSVTCQGLWAVNGGGRALFGDLPLREKASEMLRRYAVVENQMQQATVRGNEFSPEAACEISQDAEITLTCCKPSCDHSGRN